MGIWQDIRDTLEGEIAAGRYPVGARLPGELALAQRFGVNRHTVRRALAALTEAGRIHVRRGAGATVLAPPLDYALTGSAAGGPRFSRNVAAAGRRPGRRLVRLETVAASAEDARLLDIAPGAPVALIETVGLADDVAVSVGLSRLPADRLPGIEAVLAARFAGGTQTPATPGSDAVAAGDGGTITAALSAAGCTAYRRAWTRIGARAAEPGEA
ncbi:MAG: GntR family transcriptional regulator, partial [Pseudomonadota bacterium]